MPDLNVLLIEDEPSIAEAVRTLLAQNGITVTWIGDGDAGYTALCTGIYDIAVVDLLLPGLNGFKIVSQAREAGVDTPIIVLTAKSGAHDEADALEYGADDFLSKPFEPVVLVARLAALARRGRSASTPNSGVGDLALDLARNQLSYGGRVATLTRREAQLAGAILAGGGEPVAKASLLSAVWGDRGDVNTVEVYVGYLRKRLAETFGAMVQIQTVRWSGYRIVVDRT